LLSKQKWSLLEGETLNGRISHTVVRGQVVYEDGEIKVAPGYGQFINPREIAEQTARHN
jgi:allantoinase